MTSLFIPVGRAPTGSECRSRGSGELPGRRSTHRRLALRSSPLGSPACVSRQFHRGRQCEALLVVGRCGGPGTVSPGRQDSGRAIPLGRLGRGDTLAFGKQVNCDPEEPNPEQPHPRQSVVVHLSPHDLRPSSPAPELAPSGTREATVGGMSGRTPWQAFKEGLPPPNTTTVGEQEDQQAA